MSLFDNVRKIYLIGIKGVGMTALAQVLKAQGKNVAGSDTTEEFFTDQVLNKAGISYHSGFKADHINQQIDLVIKSTAYGDDNEEIQEAGRRHLKIIDYPEALGELTKNQSSIAVTGSHGKTTTTAILAYILQAAGLSPTALVGSEVIQWQGNALIGSGEWFVFEADEYQNKLQHYQPQGVILTSIDWDHPDFYKDREVYRQAFVDFLKKVPADGWVVACYDDPEVRKAVAEAGLKPEQLVTYGLGNGFVRLVRTWLEEGRWHFAVEAGDEFIDNFYFRLVGGHNVANALAVIACARKLGLDMAVVKHALQSFEGTRRRFESKGRLNNNLVLIDDYAHHPSEVTAALRGARAFYPYKNIRVVFHPHTFSRTEALQDGFAKCFTEADEVVVLDIYSSAREKTGNITAEDLVKSISEHHKNVKYLSTIKEAAEYLGETATRSDLVITMGAGDVWKVGNLLIDKFGLATGSDH